MRALRAVGLVATAGLCLGCVRRAPVAAPDMIEPGRWTAPAPAGAVVDGRFVDGRYPLSLPVPEGWRAEPAALDDATRVVLVDAEGLVRMRVSVTSGGGPEPRADCVWEFQDAASHRVGELEVELATCLPADLDAPRIVGWYARGATPPFQIEADVPPGSLLRAEDAAMVVLGGWE